MSARRVLLLAAMLLSFGAASGAAQAGYRVQMFYELRGDSVLAAEPGADIHLDLWAYDTYFTGVNAFAFRIPFDPAKLEFVGATTLCPDSTPVTATPGTGFVDVSASSCGASYYNLIVRATFRLLGVTDGTIVGLQALALVDNFGVDRLADAGTDFVQICHADGTWGDIDLDTRINSRDALIALSNAVGIPTGGFDVSRGDVDADGQVTSRDALAMLSSSIGLSTGGFRVGRGIADACARQPVFNRPLYFVREGPSAGEAGISGLAIRAANDSSVAIPGDSADAYASYQWRPRVSPDGGSVLFVCFLPVTGWGNICKANADGSGKTILTNIGRTEFSPDWSPAGDSIAYVANSQIWIMAADGSNLHAISGPVLVTSVAWRPVGPSRVLAYTTANGLGSVHTFDLNSGADALVFDAGVRPFNSAPRFADWNAVGDSIYFDFTTYYQPSIGSVPAAGGPLTMRLSLQSTSAQPLWTDAGPLFVGYYSGTYRIILAKSDGTYAIVSHDTQSHHVPGMKRQ
jgi:hypothetical protein